MIWWKIYWQMKPVEFSKPFQKRIKQRFAHQPKIISQFHQRLAMFESDVRDELLNDHALTKHMKGLHSFSISGDIRVIYRETETAYELLDIGTHNQIYQ